MTPIDNIATDVGPGIFLYIFYIKFTLFLAFAGFLMSGFPQLSYIKYSYNNLNSYCGTYNTTEICWEFNKKNTGFLYTLSYENLSKNFFINQSDLEISWLMNLAQLLMNFYQISLL
jgi:hypothetical protein